MKSINSRTALISLFFGLAVVMRGQAEEYYIYQTPNGALVISNKEPPPGSKNTKQITLPEATDSEALQSQPPNNPQANGQTEGSPKPSKIK